MVPELLTIITLGYSCYSYAMLVNDPIDPWIDFIAKTISVLLQAVVVYTSMHKHYPFVAFDDSNYEPSWGLLVAKYTLLVFYIILIILMLLATLVFIENPENNLGSLAFNFICFLILAITVVSFLRDGFADYSGHAYCDLIDQHNNTKATRCLVPGSLCPDELALYHKEFYLVNR